MSQTIKVEKFSESDLHELRLDLQRSGLDSRQVAELIRAFLAGRGYGVADRELSNMARRVATLERSAQHMQEALEQVALLM